MTLSGIFKNISVLIIALMALLLTRMGISYYIILIAIGIITPIICGNKKSAVISGILYATLSYIISYPSGLFLINHMPSTPIPISVSPFTVIINLFIAWLIPVLITIIITGISSLIGNWIAEKLNKDKTEEINVDTVDYYFEEDDDSIQIEHEEYDTSRKKDLLSLTSIQKAKNRRNKEKNW